MKPQPTPTFIVMPTAASRAGFSLRHFRRVIEEDGLRVVPIGRRFFILRTDFDKWAENKKPKSS